MDVSRPCDTSSYFIIKQPTFQPSGCRRFVLIVLIVEDEALIAAKIESTLEMLGYKICGKSMNGDKALDLFKTCKPDIALLDISI